jgi:ubiquinone/menaquinone biosynthesis C-methylase UbiE
MLFTNERSIHLGHGFGAFAHADRYDRLATAMTRRMRERIVADIATAGLPPGARVLDAGTGPGRLPLAIAAAFPELHVDGIDRSPEMIERARQNATGVDRVTFTQADVARLPFPDATFDLVVSSISQHHWVAPEQGVRDLRRVLRPGGRLWIYDARWSLGRATAAARALFDPLSVRREPLRTGRLPVRLLTRLSAQVEHQAEVEH